jgi:hypothetical protein
MGKSPKGQPSRSTLIDDMDKPSTKKADTCEGFVLRMVDGGEEFCEGYSAMVQTPAGIPRAENQVVRGQGHVHCT